MSDLIYICFLRERVRRLEAKQAGIATFGRMPRKLFVPSTMPELSPQRPTIAVRLPAEK